MANKGEIIKRLREQHGMTQDDLAAKLDTVKQTIYKYENNIVTNIPSDRIEALAKIFNVTPAYIMGWDEEEKNVYYLEPEVAELANEMAARPELKALLDASRKLTKEDLDDLAKIVNKLNRE